MNCIRNIVSPDVRSTLSTHLDDFNSKEEYLGEIANDVADSDCQVVLWENDDQQRNQEENDVDQEKSDEKVSSSLELVVNNLLNCILLVKYYIVLELEHHIGKFKIIEHIFLLYFLWMFVAFFFLRIIFHIKFFSNNHELEIHVTVLNSNGFVIS